MTVWVGDDDLIVGNLTPYYHGATLNPEFGGVRWLVEELQSGQYYKRQAYEEYNEISKEDADYICSIADYWDTHSLAAHCDATIPDEFYQVEAAKIIPFNRTGTGGNPIGHFAANYSVAIDKGFAAVKAEAQAKLRELNGNLMEGDVQKHLFYRSVVIYCDAVMTLAKRYEKNARKCPKWKNTR